MPRVPHKGMLLVYVRSYKGTGTCHAYRTRACYWYSVYVHCSPLSHDYCTVPVRTVRVRAESAGTARLAFPSLFCVFCLLAASSTIINWKRTDPSAEDSEKDIRILKPAAINTSTQATSQFQAIHHSIT